MSGLYDCFVFMVCFGCCCVACVLGFRSVMCLVCCCCVYVLYVCLCCCFLFLIVCLWLGCVADVLLMFCCIGLLIFDVV